MKWIKYISLSIVVLALFAGGIAFDIFVIKKFSKQATISPNSPSVATIITQDLSAMSKNTPQNFHAYPIIKESIALRNAESLGNEDRLMITQSFNETIKIINASKVCTGGSYNLQPIEYFAGNTLKRGYSASLNMECTFQASQKDNYQQVLNEIMNIANKNPLLEFGVPNITPFISQDEQRQSEQNLRGDLIIQAKELAAYYTKALALKCHLSKMTFHSIPTPRPYAFNAKSANYSSVSSEVNNIILPTPKEEEIELGAKVTLECQ
ncbi:hypothetical protein [Helicobacter sp. MIT 14-3879]|uniref:hypothetical protein n=1 Tax=Helicobacter sp. MIT 14-3879 TaxID=2040649 RepID=UPI000E1EFD9D|nr:hypothetical protein [Helicobacter sp. MIT 14-3879]RDU61457.1 hypothetical protein CQA44_08880 [Helicobacter sp. MIT 14-3879]